MSKINIRGQVVLVTGASSGIGRAISESLAAREVHVLACARRESDISALTAIPNVTGLRLDVTRIPEIQAVAAWLSEKGIRLYGIVNNAGIAVGGPLLTLPASEIEDCLRVNTLGPANVVRELYPYMEPGGCIVNMSSIGARYVTPWMGPYHMSKFALEAFCESLRMELSPLGTRVAIVEPGAVKTAAFEKWDRLVKHMQGTIYEQAFARYWAMIRAQHQHALAPARVAEVVIRILQDPRPRKRTLIPHRPVVRIVILLAALGVSDRIYDRYLRDVPWAHPSAFLDRPQPVGEEKQDA